MALRSRVFDGRGACDIISCFFFISQTDQADRIMFVFFCFNKAAKLSCNFPGTIISPYICLVLMCVMCISMISH